MKPDNAISRIVRPGVLIFLTALFTFIVLADGNLYTFTVKEVYSKGLEALLEVAYTAYFLGKSVEHSTRIYNDRGGRYGRNYPIDEYDEYDNSNMKRDERV